MSWDGKVRLSREYTSVTLLGGREALTLYIVMNVRSGFLGLDVTGSSRRSARQGWSQVRVPGLS